MSTIEWLKKELAGMLAQRQHLLDNNGSQSAIKQLEIDIKSVNDCIDQQERYAQ